MSVKSEKVVKGLLGLDEVELLEVLRNGEVLERMRELRKVGEGLKVRGDERISDGEKVCVRCNRGVEVGKKYREIDGMVFGVECGGKYLKERDEGLYDGLEGERLREEILGKYKKMMSEKMKNRGWGFVD